VFSSDIYPSACLQTKSKTDAKKAINKFFGDWPDEDSDWSNNLWSGGFFSILAYVGLHDVPPPDWSTLEINTEEVAKVHRQYPTAFTMATVYERLGDEAVCHHKSSKTTSLQKRDWDSVRSSKVVAFDMIENMVQAHEYIAEWIKHDRLLCIVAERMPDIGPWKDAQRFFVSRPSTHILSYDTLALYVKRYETNDEATALIRKLQLTEQHDASKGNKLKRCQDALHQVRNLDAYKSGTL
jgi:hypothetical protein